MDNLRKLANDTTGFAKAVSEIIGQSVYAESVCVDKEMLFAMARKGTSKSLLVLSSNSDAARDFTGETDTIATNDLKATVTICPLTHDNAKAVRAALPFTAPTTFGLQKTVGTGDRLGIATPGHIRAVTKSTMRPVLALQSIREMARTKRTPNEVIDAACWGVLQAGYKDGYAADADHSKNTNDIDLCFNLGYRFYTVDPSEYVDSTAEANSVPQLEKKFSSLPWARLQSTVGDCITNYADKDIILKGAISDVSIAISGLDLLRGAVKYGRAIAHAAAMYEYLKERFGNSEFDYEISVDETATPTSVAEHYYIASELNRLGVKWTSLAPRFVGDFEKGIDYIGDLNLFRTEFAQHAAIARQLGPYNISLHSGSDKFKIYPIVAELAGDLVYLKTAGTSYLEALRALAKVNPDAYRDILAFSRERYEEDRATYHVSADPAKAAVPEKIKNEDLPNTLDQFHTRQICHVTFGSVLTTQCPRTGIAFKDTILNSLREDENVYYEYLEKHIGRHVTPFK